MSGNEGEIQAGRITGEKKAEVKINLEHGEVREVYLSGYNLNC